MWRMKNKLVAWSLLLKIGFRCFIVKSHPYPFSNFLLLVAVQFLFDVKTTIGIRSDRVVSVK